MRYVCRHRSNWLVLLMAALMVTLDPVHAQLGCDTSRVTVAADLSKRQLGALPFDVPFTIRTPVPTLRDDKLKVDSVVLRYGSPARVGSGFGLSSDALRSTARVLGAAPPTELTFSIRALQPNEVQYFDFFVYAPQSDTARPKQILPPDTIRLLKFDPATGTFAVGRDSIVQRVKMVDTSVAIDTFRIVGKPRATLTNHFDADAGVLWAPGFGYWGAGTNSHFYFRPVNRNQCTDDYEGMDHLLKRVSVFVGVSLFRIHTDTEVEHLWTNGSPVMGIGVNRLPLVPARLNAGIIWLRQDDPNPLVTRQVVKRDFFISGTIDFELQQLVGPLVTLVGLK